MSTYYQQVRSPEDFAALATGARNPSVFLKGDKIRPAGRPALLAYRVLCNAPGPTLSILDSYLPADGELEGNKIIGKLISGPSYPISELVGQAEQQVLTEAGHDSVVATWGGLSHALICRSTPTACAFKVWRDGRHKYHRRNYPSSRPCVLPLIRSFVDCIAKSGLVRDSKSNFTLRVRPKDLPSRSFTPRNRSLLRARDDGGIRIFKSRGPLIQVASIKAMFDGCMLLAKPTISDEVLSEIVTATLAQALGDTSRHVSDTDFVMLLPAGRFLKFLHFQIPELFIETFEDLDPQEGHDDRETFLDVFSTHWFDLTISTDRKRVAEHIIGLARWARVILTAM